jgi:undecaprenyl-diphosphatase
MLVRRPALCLAICALATPCVAHAGGPFGIDYRVHYDNSGIWKRSIQKDVEYATIIGALGGALALGDHDKLGDTFWRSVDALAVTAATTEAMKYTFQRERPSDTNDPNKFFRGSKYQSFPSGEVASVAAAVTPFMVNYGEDHPAVYALAALPLYDAIARVKVHGHWQSDVLIGAAIGTGIGYWAARRQSSLLVGWLPGGFSVGYVHRF